MAERFLDYYDIYELMKSRVMMVGKQVNIAGRILLLKILRLNLKLLHSTSLLNNRTSRPHYSDNCRSSKLS